MSGVFLGGGVVFFCLFFLGDLSFKGMSVEKLKRSFREMLSWILLQV